MTSPSNSVREFPPIGAYADDEPRVESAEALEAEPGKTLRPLCDVADIGVGDFLDKEPEPRVWILEDLLPLGIVGAIGATGGVGKSFLMLQLAISVATGRPFLGIKVTDPGSVLMLCAEDERHELHRRFWRIVEMMREGQEFGLGDDELVRERLFVTSRVGENNLLTHVVEGMTIRTSMGERIALTAEQIPALKLIVLDPVARFRGGGENSNDDATRFVEAVETLRARTGATVLMPHHASKEAIKAGTERLGLESMRGATGLSDGIRWVGVMATLRKDVAPDFGIDPEEASRYVRLDVPKLSYGPPWDGLWLKREHGGVLVPCELESKRKRRNEKKAEQRYRETLEKLKGLIGQEHEKGKPLTRNRLRDFAGTPGMFGCSDKTLRSILERAIVEGEIKTIPSNSKNKVEELRTW